MPIFPIPPNVVDGGIIEASDVADLYDAINGLLDEDNIALGAITGANIAASTIGVGNLKTSFATLGIQQAAAAHFGGGFFVLPSGAYSFWPGIYTDSSTTTTSGTATATNGSAAVVWASGNNFITGNRWVTPTKITITLGGVPYAVTAVADATHLTLTANYAGTTGVVAFSVSEYTIGSLAGNVTSDTQNDINVANPSGLARLAGSTTPTGLIWLAVLNAVNTGTNQAFAGANYIQASPPYDLGDGPIPLFVFAVLDENGDPKMTYAAPDPPWAYHPTPRPKLPVTLKEAMTGPEKMAEYLDGLQKHKADVLAIKSLTMKATKARTAEERKGMLDMAKEIRSRAFTDTTQTQEEKNKYMSEIPHPFIHNDLQGKTVVMLDPQSKDVAQMADMHAAGENVVKLLHRGMLKIGNDVERRAGGGVKVVEGKFANDKQSQTSVDVKGPK